MHGGPLDHANLNTLRASASELWPPCNTSTYIHIHPQTDGDYTDYLKIISEHVFFSIRGRGQIDDTRRYWYVDDAPPPRCGRS